MRNPTYIYLYMLHKAFYKYEPFKFFGVANSEGHVSPSIQRKITTKPRKFIFSFFICQVAPFTL